MKTPMVLKMLLQETLRIDFAAEGRWTGNLARGSTLNSPVLELRLYYFAEECLHKGSVVQEE